MWFVGWWVGCVLCSVWVGGCVCVCVYIYIHIYITIALSMKYNFSND